MTYFIMEHYEALLCSALLAVHYCVGNMLHERWGTLCTSGTHMVDAFLQHAADMSRISIWCIPVVTHRNYTCVPSSLWAHGSCTMHDLASCKPQAFGLRSPAPGHAIVWKSRTWSFQKMGLISLPWWGREKKHQQKPRTAWSIQWRPTLI